MDRNADQLLLTATAIEAWREAIVCNCQEDLKTAFQGLVTVCAKSEWGEHAYCEFNRETVRVLIEHFDGRKRVL